MTTHASQVWFVTGANKGLGAAIVQEALDQGHVVIAAARKPETITELFGSLPNLHPVQLDLTVPAQISAAVAKALSLCGRIDVLVNNAGYGLLGYFEEFSDAVIRRQMETNVFGTMNLTREVLPVMRTQGSGWIVNFSSTSGIKSVEGGAVYSASKFAIEGWTEGLAIELAPLGIKCMIVEPGAFRTDFFNENTSFAFADGRVAAYDSRRQDLLDHFTAWDKKQPGDPKKLAKVLLSTLVAKNPPLRLLCGRYAASSIAAYYEARRAEFDAWRHVTESTDFDE